MVLTGSFETQPPWPGEGEETKQRVGKKIKREKEMRDMEEEEGVRKDNGWLGVWKV